MSHLNDPATRLLGCPCLICSTPLRDAKSVAIGIGPTCRKNVGLAAALDSLDEADRTRANKLIWEAAKVRKTDLDRVMGIAEELRGMADGVFETLADRIRDNFIGIKLVAATIPKMRWDRQTRSEVDTGDTVDVFELHTPYVDGFKNILFRHVGRDHYRAPVYVADDTSRRGRRFSHWAVGRSATRELYGVLAECFPGVMAWGPRGAFSICTLENYNDNHKRRRAS